MNINISSTYSNVLHRLKALAGNFGRSRCAGKNEYLMVHEGVRAGVFFPGVSPRHLYNAERILHLWRRAVCGVVPAATKVIQGINSKFWPACKRTANKKWNKKRNYFSEQQQQLLVWSANYSGPAAETQIYIRARMLCACERRILLPGCQGIN